MPKTKIPVKPNTYENDCEKVKSMADEYLHDELIVFGGLENSGDSRELELSEDDRGFIDGHLGACAGCLAFIESESIYFENMAQAGYEPEASVWEFVANKINGGVTVEKPKKRRIVPFGLISAAAVVLIMFAVYKGVPGIFMKSSDMAQNVERSAAKDSRAEMLAAPEMDYGDAKPETAEGGAGTGEAWKAGGDYPREQDAPAGAAPAPPAPAAEAEDTVFDPDTMSDARFWEVNLDLAIEWLYRIDFAGGEKIGDILEGIEIYRADPEGRFYIAGLRYKDKLEENMSAGGISAEADAAYNPNAKATDEKYIAILCY